MELKKYLTAKNLGWFAAGVVVGAAASYFITKSYYAVPAATTNPDEESSLAGRPSGILNSGGRNIDPNCYNRCIAGGLSEYTCRKNCGS
jgi:hypothetical protein